MGWPMVEETVNAGEENTNRESEVEDNIPKRYRKHQNTAMSKEKNQA